MDGKKLNDMLFEAYGELTDEQKRKAEACETLGALTAVFAETGVALPDELMDAVLGGACVPGWSSNSNHCDNYPTCENTLPWYQRGLCPTCSKVKYNTR